MRSRIIAGHVHRYYKGLYCSMCEEDDLLDTAAVPNVIQWD